MGRAAVVRVRGGVVVRVGSATGTGVAIIDRVGMIGESSPASCADGAAHRSQFTQPESPLT